MTSGGLATFQLLRHRRNEPEAFLYAFDLLELPARAVDAVVLGFHDPASDVLAWTVRSHCRAWATRKGMVP